MKRFRIEVPASTANLGPGFDALGMALDMVDTFQVEIDPEGSEVRLDRVHGIEEQFDPHDNLLCRAYATWGEEQGVDLPGATFTVESRIALARGMGSSAACILAGLAAAARATDTKSPMTQIIRIASKLEGHPDNVTAAALGGLTVALCQSDEVHVLHVVNHASMSVILYIPDEPLLTSKARKILPESVPLADAVYNAGRAAYLVTAFMWGRWEEIGVGMQDRLHQPYRASLIPCLPDVMQAALDAGAYGAALSGGGPSVIAFGPISAAEAIAEAMERTAAASQWAGKSLITSIRATGLQVHEEQEGQGS